MKKLKLKELENNKNKLKQYKLDKNSISEFKNKIKQVSALESEKLAIDLSALIKSDNFNDDYLKVTELIYNGADVNYDIECNELLDICISNNYNKTIIVLLRAGIDINTLNHNQITPIMVCAEVGNKEILELLILMGADINYENNIGETALSLALGCNNRECADILTNAQVHLNYESINDNFIIDENPMNLIKEVEDKLNNLNNLNNNSLIDYSLMGQISLLTKEQILFGNKQLDIINICGDIAIATGFASLLGCQLSSTGIYIQHIDELVMTGKWWTKSSSIYNNYAISVTAYGLFGDSELQGRKAGIRPVIPYSLIKSEVFNKKITDYGVVEIEYGEYPQTIVEKQYSNLLEQKFNNRLLNKTGKIYTTDSVNWKNNKTGFTPKEHIEYELYGKKYIRFIANENCYDFDEVLDGGREIKLGEVYWVKVEPIIWLVDEKSNITLSKKILVSGIQFDNSNQYDGVFENTFMYKYLNEIFAKDIIPSKQLYNKQLIKK